MRPVTLHRAIETGVEAERATDADLVRMVCLMALGRRRRCRHLPSQLFGEPCWDMLLDLFVAHFEGRPIYVSSLCIAAAVPSTTALRYVTMLEEHDLIVRRRDPVDRRRTFVELTGKGIGATRRSLVAFLAVINPKA